MGRRLLPRHPRQTRRRRNAIVANAAQEAARKIHRVDPKSATSEPQRPRASVQETILNSVEPNANATRNGFRPVSLDAVNFLAAHVRGAVGPYLNVFLVTQQHWSQSDVGLVRTLGGLL
jgi:hypothetical protein